MLAYKGFNKDLQCRGFQFAVGETFKVATKPIRCGGSGFHACDNPADVWTYYGPVDETGSLNRFAIVEAVGDVDRGGAEDTKFATAELHIKAELKFPDFVRRVVDYIVEATKGKSDSPAGNHARIGSSGDSAQIGSSGDSAQIGSSGYGARIGSSGYGARIGSSGDSAQIGSSGDSAQIGSSGDGARIGSSGNHARIDATGEKPVICSAGRDTKVKGKAGSWISLAQYNDKGECIGFASGCIGKKGLKPDTWYIAKRGKLVKATD